MWIVNRQRVPMTPYQLLNTKYMMDTITRLRSCFPRISRQFPHLAGKSCGSFELCLTLCAAVLLSTPYKSQSLSYFCSEPFSCSFNATVADRRCSSDSIYREDHHPPPSRLKRWWCHGIHAQPCTSTRSPLYPEATSRV